MDAYINDDTNVKIASDTKRVPYQDRDQTPFIKLKPKNISNNASDNASSKNDSPEIEDDHNPSIQIKDGNESDASSQTSVVYR